MFSNYFSYNYILIHPVTRAYTLIIVAKNGVLTRHYVTLIKYYLIVSHLFCVLSCVLVPAFDSG